LGAAPVLGEDYLFVASDLYATKADCEAAIVIAKSHTETYVVTPCPDVASLNKPTKPNINVPIIVTPVQGLHFKEDYTLLAPIGNMKVIDKNATVGDYFNTIFMIVIGLCGH